MQSLKSFKILTTLKNETVSVLKDFKQSSYKLYLLH